jgi:hypothetical protein
MMSPTDYAGFSSTLANGSLSIFSTFFFFVWSDWGEDDISLPGKLLPDWSSYKGLIHILIESTTSYAL